VCAQVVQGSAASRGGAGLHGTDPAPGLAAPRQPGVRYGGLRQEFPQPGVRQDLPQPLCPTQPPGQREGNLDDLGGPEILSRLGLCYPVPPALGLRGQIYVTEAVPCLTNSASY